MAETEISFESSQTMGPDAFAEWVEERTRWDPNHFELLNGRIVMNPPAGYPHGAIENNVQFIVTSFVRTHALGHVFGSSQGFELPSGDTVEPDTSFVSMQRWRAAPAPVSGKFLRVVPDLLVEIASISTGSRDRGEKKAIYERNGVREYWIIDSRTREITQFLLRNDRFEVGSVHSESARFSSEVLSGLEVVVRELFP